MAAVTLWKGVLVVKEYLFSNDVLWCNTVFAPLHKALRKYESYRYVSALLLGPDDQLWEDLGIPYVQSTWRDGSLDFTRPQHVSDLEHTRKHGRVFGTYEGRTPVLVISEPNLIREVIENYSGFRHRRVYLCGHEQFDVMLPMLEGQTWRRVKDTIRKPFSSTEGVNARTDLMEKCADVVVDQILKIADDDGIVDDGLRAFGVYAMDVIIRIIYGKPIEDFKNPDNFFIRNAKVFLFEGTDEILLKTIRYPEFKREPEDCAFHPGAIDFFVRYVEAEVFERIVVEMGMKHNDLLEELIDHARSGNLDFEEVYAQVAILTVLAYYSISFTLAVACFEISQNNKIQDRLQYEIDSAILRNGGINDKALQEMSYLEWVLNEAMRKYPVATRIERVCNSATTVGDLPIAEGTVIAIPIYTLHHDPELYQDPESFDPDRFSKVYTYCRFMPFGERQRKCLAQVFAMREMKVFMASLLSRVTLLPSENPRPLNLTSKKNLLLSEHISFTVERRKLGDE